MYAVGEKVKITDDCLEIYDTGVIQHVIKGELLPYQVLCEKGDEDGHKVLRFNDTHLSPALEEVKTPALPVVEVVQSQQTFQAGQQYFAEERTGGTHYTLYTHDMRCRGVMPIAIFKITQKDVPDVHSKRVEIISNANVPELDKKRVSKREKAKIEITRIITKIRKEKKVKKAKTHFEKMEALGQINLFELEDLS